jgi:hypothetical protein
MNLNRPFSGKNIKSKRFAKSDFFVPEGAVVISRIYKYYQAALKTAGLANLDI